MSVILRNEYGAIAVNKGVIESMIIEDLLGMDEHITLCNKKGKPVRSRNGRHREQDYLDAIEVYEKKGSTKVKIYLITLFGESISRTVESIFTLIERDFDLLKLSKPGTISVNVKGIMNDTQLFKRNIEVVRNNAGKSQP